MKAEFDVTDREQARWLRRGLRVKAIRDFVILAGKMSEIDAPYIPQVMGNMTEQLRSRLVAEALDRRAATKEPG